MMAIVTKFMLFAFICRTWGLRSNANKGFYRRRLSRTSLSSSSSSSSWAPDFSPYKETFNSLTDEQWLKLEQLAFKLYDWNSKVNLISRKDIDFLLPNHIIPCLSMSLVKKFQLGETVIDVGTGGGLPGLPLAIAFPHAKFTLLDSNSKKMAIVDDIASSLGLSNVRVVCSRAEKLTESYDFLLGRAVSALPNYLGFSQHLLKKNSPIQSATLLAGYPISSGLLYLKGGDFSNELEDAGINEHSLFPVSNLVPQVESDKFVLYIPADEIHKRKPVAAVAVPPQSGGTGTGVAGKVPTSTSGQRKKQ